MDVYVSNVLSDPKQYPVLIYVNQEEQDEKLKRNIMQNTQLKFLMKIQNFNTTDDNFKSLQSSGHYL